MDLKPKTKTAAIIILIVIGLLIIFSLSQTKTGPHSRPIPVLTDKELKCQTNSDCQLVDVECCNNNMAKQNTCINKAEVANWKQKLMSFCTATQIACPEFFMLADYSCSCENQVCLTTINTSIKVFNYSGIYQGT